jgi:hypothetical protein
MGPFYTVCSHRYRGLIPASGLMEGPTNGWHRGCKGNIKIYFNAKKSLAFGLDFFFSWYTMSRATAK